MNGFMTAIRRRKRQTQSWVFCWTSERGDIPDAVEHSGKSHLWSHQCHGVSYGWPFGAKFNNVYLYATIYIDSTSTQHIFIQRLYSFNFNRGYFCARQIFIQLQRPKLCFMKRIYIYSTSTKKIFSFNKTYLFKSSSSRTSINFFFNKAPPPYPPAAPSLKTCQNVFLFSFNYNNTKIYISIYIYMLTIDNIFTKHIIFILKLY